MGHLSMSLHDPHHTQTKPILGRLEKLLVALQKANRRSHAHNFPGGIKHLLSDPKRCHWFSVRSTSHSSFTSSPTYSHRSHHRLMQLRAKVANPAAQTLFAPTAPVSESGSHSQPQSQSTPHPINVLFPQRLPELPRKQISSNVLSSLGFTPEVPSQYICNQMERLGPM